MSGFEPIPYESVAGLKEAGWSSDMYSRVLSSKSPTTNSRLKNQLRRVLEACKSENGSWPFHEPVYKNNI